MSRINNTALISYTDVSNLEDKINTQFAETSDISINDILIFVKVSPYSFYPLESTVDDKGKIKIKNSSDYIGLELYVGSKHQFLHKRITISQDTYKLELDESFKTAWNPDRFIIFQDGYLMNHGLFTYIIPSFDNNYLRKYIYSASKFKKNSRVDIYYIESYDNFKPLPISRDLYLGAIRYIARKNNEKIIPIPYPFKNKKSSFFIFNENGEYLDKGKDYIVSYDEVYITLRKPLALATVDYIIFAFPMLSKEKEFVEPTEVFGPLSGSPYFKYSYSVQSNYNTTGLVRFSPIYDEYVLTKKNFLLFGNGEWINPNRFEVHSNDAILFNNRQDQEICANIDYTMVIFEDNTDHTQFSLPRDFFVVKLRNKEPNQKVFKIEDNIPFKCKSFVVFKNNQLVTEYYYDEDSEKIHFVDPVNEDIYLVCFSTQVNNTNQDILVYTTSFDCESNGTTIPEEYVLNNLNNSWVLIFLDGALLNPDQYTIRNGKIYLNSSLQGSSISMLLLISGFKKDPIKRTEKQIQMIQQWQENVDYNLQETAYFYIRSSARPTERGVIPLLDTFNRYKLNKRNMLLFNSGGVWIDPQRFDLVDNNKLYLVSPYDHERSLYTSTYYAITLDDKLTDEKYSPPNVLVVHVKAEENYQSLFEIPKVHRRFRSFILFKGSILLNREYNYVIENEIHVKLTNTLDYMRKGRSLTFVFLDAYSRFGQENLFIQSSFECKLNQATPLPVNFLHERFNIDNIAIFFNGLFMSPDKYKIVNNSILLDGFIELESLSTRIFTILYMTTIPIGLRHYDYFIPPYPDIPIKENDVIPSVYFTRRSITTTQGRITDITPSFTDYPLGKQNFMLFGDQKWIHPDHYQLYSNDKLIWEIDNTFSKSEMIIFNDSLVRTDDINIPPSIKTLDVDINGNSVDVPSLGEQYESFLVFDKNSGKLIETTIDNTYDEVENKIILSSNLHTTLTFVFLRSYMTTLQQLMFYQYSFKFTNNSKIPLSIFESNNFQYLILFENGMYIPSSKYSISNGYISSSYLTSNSTITIVYLLSLVPDTEDHYDQYVLTRPEYGELDGFHFSYSYSNPIVNKNSQGIITFSPAFTRYSLTKDSFLLFGNGTWIHPDRFNLNSNTKITFNNTIDKQHSDYVNYAIVVPYENKEGYDPITIKLYKLIATEEQQSLFTLPEELNKYSTFLTFIGGLLVPNNERLKITKTQVSFTNANDYLELGRELDIVVLDDSNVKDRRFPIFVQDTFEANSDPTKGTDIPSNWYLYETTMLVFFAGRYITPDLYRIENHKIFLDSDFVNSDMLKSSNVKRKYTLVYIAANIIEEYWEKKAPIIEAEPTPKRFIPQDDPLDFTGYYFDIYESEYDINGYISYDPGFTSYNLTKEDFLLFGNSTFIHPLRYTFINNKSLRMIDEVDRKHAPFVLYNMVIPFSKDAKLYYKEDYVKPKFKVVEIITTERTNELEFPVLDGEYESVLMFRNSLILPIYDEDRFVIDDINHKFMIVNEADWIPANTRVTFIFMSSKTNTDTKILLVQDSFKCVDYFTQIPNSIYRYPGQKFNKAKMLLYLNGTFVVPERYRLYNNTIFLVDDDIDLNDDHTFTIVYLDEVYSTEYDIETNLIDRTYEDGLDDIIFETEVVKPL